MIDFLSVGLGLVIGILAFVALSFAVQPIIRRHEEELAVAAPVVMPPRPSPAPDAVQDWKKFCEDNGWTDCTEFRGKMAGLYVGPFGEVNILVRADHFDTRHELLSPLAGVLFVQAQPGYEEKIIVPKPGTNVQVIRGGENQRAYFIGIIN